MINKVKKKIRVPHLVPDSHPSKCTAGVLCIYTRTYIYIQKVNKMFKSEFKMFHIFIISN